MSCACSVRDGGWLILDSSKLTLPVVAHPKIVEAISSPIHNVSLPEVSRALPVTSGRARHCGTQCPARRGPRIFLPTWVLPISVKAFGPMLPPPAACRGAGRSGKRLANGDLPKTSANDRPNVGPTRAVSIRLTNVR